MIHSDNDEIVELRGAVRLMNLTAETMHKDIQKLRAENERLKGLLYSIKHSLIFKSDANSRSICMNIEQALQDCED